MIITAGIDVGSTYTKVVLLNEKKEIVGKHLNPTGFQLEKISRQTLDEALAKAGLTEGDISYIVATGIGRHQATFKDIHVTDLTASARGTALLFPGTRTVLDIGGQTMKASRLDELAKVLSFRLNDKCAAGTGAFLEKTARYMGFSTEEIGPLMETSKEPVPISGVCAVFAESEVINHLSIGTPPADIMQGAIESLTGRAVQLIRRVKAGPQYTLIGGIMRFSTMAKTVQTTLQADVNVPDGEMVQYVSALGASVLGHVRLQKLGSSARREQTPA